MMSFSIPYLLGGLSLLMLIGPSCSKQREEALGTLEWDRINGRAVDSETIVEIYAKEGEPVERGQKILKLDTRVQEAQVARLRANMEQASWNLQQLQHGYRSEEIARAQAEFEGAQANRKAMEIEYQRKQELKDSTAVSQREVNLSANAYAQSQAKEQAAKEQLNMLKKGYRKEEIEQAKSHLAAAQAELNHAKEQLSRYTVTAERAGLLDSLPFKLGDKPPVGAVVSTILAGKAPWARVYLPAPWLSRIKAGDQVDIMVDGREQPIQGTVRHIESNASFTPYYTLSEEDRSRLSYVTEIDLDPEIAKDFPLGLPVRMLEPHE
ncbi:HlyD family efflux transporter periplasmic adaptor subunit [Verrucomicrobiaceae bacterium N1E253]|uniref:HlyD family efflux transporter periplasmic adaptor subunit n=1 Tax=Oceaniferula marina TaxID=2748318 RepID=A0A851GJM3_9BACT|nr:HlyD family efflux transporter periplasmic adaptor subunit [Oceaniferula marina]NWK56071.1 HlyD family efflux transporter periplasmic adaptor subunit [Oceaniferula marina]